MTEEINIAHYDRIGEIKDLELYEYDGVKKNAPEYVLVTEDWQKFPVDKHAEIVDVVALVRRHGDEE